MARMVGHDDTRGERVGDGGKGKGHGAGSSRWQEGRGR
jgi:hypothetical protein